MNAIVPLGDQAALAYFAEEAEALAFAHAVEESKTPWVVEVVAAYRSVAVYFDLGRVRFGQIADRLGGLARRASRVGRHESGRLHEIPCCYEMQSDMERVMRFTGLSAEEVVRWHSQTEYTVYAIGFCPGFPYLGYLPQALANVPRLESPRLRVEAGSVGLTGRQTGIYTLPRPGGWNLIGRTPLELVNVEEGYFPLRAGDRVRFVSVSKSEYDRLRGRRL